MPEAPITADESHTSADSDGGTGRDARPGTNDGTGMPSSVTPPAIVNNSPTLGTGAVEWICRLHLDHPSRVTSTVTPKSSAAGPE